MAADLTVAMLGLGEAGSTIAADFVAAGVIVRGYDPAVRGVEGVEDFGDEAQAVRGADVVVSVNSAAAAVDAARVAAAELRSGQVFADLNTAAPALKRDVEAVVAPTGAAFADVALLRPVPGLGSARPRSHPGPAGRSSRRRWRGWACPSPTWGRSPARPRGASSRAASS